ncbi:MAG TPA: 5'-nucleotidase C-terminal domain-containing protein, partial [Myxococcaceae bacterium]|nr:5'-nucleotidase C-terminal domain-containing protein [Myxococcaceae bacterium]
SRIVSITLHGQPLEPQRTYTLATNSYLASGGDGDSMLKGSRFLVSPEKGPATQEVLRDAFASSSPISPAPQGRIERLRSGAPDTLDDPEATCSQVGSTGTDTLTPSLSRRERSE